MVEILPLLVAPVARKVAREERERERAHATVSFRSRAIEFQPFLLLFPSPLIIFVDHRIIVSEGAEKKNWWTMIDVGLRLLPFHRVSEILKRLTSLRGVNFIREQGIR